MVDAVCLARRTRVHRSTVFPRKLSLSTAGTDMARTLHKQSTPNAAQAVERKTVSPPFGFLQEEQHELQDQ
jgi:hypothetical protein